MMRKPFKPNDYFMQTKRYRKRVSDPRTIFRGLSRVDAEASTTLILPQH